MEKDFHYYLIYAIARTTGFEKAEEMGSGHDNCARW